ncbi:MAG TPA: helix-turn-helix transcriptional regulator [Clostridiaceae bacterium]|nr:helix-turn-helix transcriptional regulator [Clostridiaceae bacterium]
MNNIEVAKYVGQHLRQTRKSRGMSILTVACETDMDLSYLSHMERGFHYPTIKKLALICDSLEIKLSDFFSEIEASLDENSQEKSPDLCT